MGCVYNYTFSFTFALDVVSS